MKRIPRPEEPPTPLDLLERDHARIESIFDALMEAFRADARVELLGLWTKLETLLLSHMNAEERWVLPSFARVDCAEAAALLEEHVRLRAMLEQLGTGVELHAIPAAVAAEFREVLRAHGRREDALLHRWVEKEGRSTAAQRPEKSA